MRYHEIASGHRIYISKEEQEMLDRIKKDPNKSSMDERQQHVASKMVSSGLLNRTRDKDNKIVFKISSIENLWRD